MARRRLHGETQSKRNKKSQQALKRSGSVGRKQSLPPPDARNALPERPDLEFLEAMHEGGVKPISQPLESPGRGEKLKETLEFQETESSALFQGEMTQQGVKALDEKKPEPNPENRPAEKPPAQKSGPPPHLNAIQKPSKQPVADVSPRSGVTQFVDEPEDADWMAQAMEEVDPAKKFEGAPKRTHQPGKSVTPEPDGRGIDDSLDLHGKTREEAIAMVQNFLLKAHKNHLRQVLIITGKGLGSGPEGPVLREAVWNWLERNGKQFAHLFDWAPPSLGGQGAIWVKLR